MMNSMASHDWKGDKSPVHDRLEAAEKLIEQLVGQVEYLIDSLSRGGMYTSKHAKEALAAAKAWKEAV